MSDADWDLMSELLQFPNSADEILAEHKQRQRESVRADKGADPPAVVSRAKRTSSTHATPSVPQPTVTYDSQAATEPAHVASAPVAVALVDPVKLLLAGLDAATDDAERERLLQAAPYEVRTALDNFLTYSAFTGDCARKSEAERKSFAAFTAALDACSVDDARVALIQAAPAAFLAEWSWRQTATDDSWTRRYLALVGADKGN